METKANSYTFIIRYSGELSLKKGRERMQAIAKIIRQISTQLDKHSVEYSYEKYFNYIQLNSSDLNFTKACLKKCFGVNSFSLVEEICDADIEVIKSKMSIFEDYVKDHEFRVKAKRTGSHNYSSVELEKQAGAVLAKWGKVKLKDPEKIVNIDVINQKAFLYGKKLKGPGGLPPSNKERALVLMSGGFDSAVAAWKTLKRGVACDFLFCNMGGKATERQCLQVTKVLVDLWGPSTKARFYSIDFNPVIDEIKKISDPGYRQILLKRQMYRAADRILKQSGCMAIVSGECIGQVSSQSLQNLRSIDACTNALFLRPLIGDDKLEIMDIAYKIGTGILSEKVTELCGITQGKAVLKSSQKKIGSLEKEIDIDCFQKAVDEKRIFDIDKLEGKDLQANYLFVDSIDANAQAIDCRQSFEFKAWHYPGAIHRELKDLLSNYKDLDKNKTYVLYCSFGSQTPLAAEILQQSGYQAYAFAGGIKKLKQQSPNN
jgi:thiamine biosynthesis protein ThiI